MTKSPFAFCALLVAFCAYAAEPRLCGTVTKVTDGDTFVLNIDTPPNLPPVLSYHVPIRIRGIDTPELHDKDACVKSKAKLALKTLRHLLPDALCLQNPERDKYWRLVADVPTVSGEDMATILVKMHVALPYNPKLPKPVHTCRFP